MSLSFSLSFNVSVFVFVSLSPLNKGRRQGDVEGPQNGPDDVVGADVLIPDAGSGSGSGSVVGRGRGSGSGSVAKAAGPGRHRGGDGLRGRLLGVLAGRQGVAQVDDGVVGRRSEFSKKVKISKNSFNSERIETT